jgi:alkylation response protein AidB-like acyl-CoA dehydrogenase
MNIRSPVTGDEVKFEEILEGTSEIQRVNIARRVLKL